MMNLSATHASSVNPTTGEVVLAVVGLLEREEEVDALSSRRRGVG